jgi:hypothetical protein
MGDRPTGSQEEWVESLGKFDQRVHWERPGLGSVSALTVAPMKLVSRVISILSIFFS